MIREGDDSGRRVPCSTALTLVEHRVMRMALVLVSVDSSNPGLLAFIVDATSLAMLPGYSFTILSGARFEAKKQRDRTLVKVAIINGSLWSLTIKTTVICILVSLALAVSVSVSNRVKASYQRCHV